MKKLLSLLLTAGLCAALLAGCGGTSDTTEDPAPEGDDTTASSLEERTTFTVGFDAEFPPFGFVADDGSYDGFDLAVAQEVCNRLGWEFVAQPIAWEAKDAELSSGNIDCIWNGFTMQGREDSYTFSESYYNNCIVMVVKADSGIGSLADLAGKNVITQAGSSALDALEADESGLTESFGQLLEAADYNSAFLELEQGSVDAIAADIGVANYNMESKAGAFSILPEAISSEDYGIGFLKGETELRDLVNQTVKEIAEDGTMAQIAEKYVEYGLVMDSLILIPENQNAQ